MGEKLFLQQSLVFTYHMLWQKHADERLVMRNDLPKQKVR